MWKGTLLRCFHTAPAVYPFRKPFYDTPHDQDRHRLNYTFKETRRNWPAWMDVGADGTGSGVGLHRTHPLSKLRGNVKRRPQHVPRVVQMMIKGVYHKSGVKLYYRGGKVPNPSKQPYLTGEPCPLYGWKVLDYNVIREFTPPHMEKEKVVYKPYVAIQEEPAAEFFGPAIGQTTRPERKSKPLMKRLFFWK